MVLWLLRYGMSHPQWGFLTLAGPCQVPRFAYSLSALHEQAGLLSWLRSWVAWTVITLTISDFSQCWCFSLLKPGTFLFLFAEVFSIATAQQKTTRKKFEGENGLLTHRISEDIHSNYCTHPSTLRMALYLKSSQILKMRFHVSSLLFYWQWFNIFWKKYSASFYDR